jgi:creatinine amidohydrolase/Fe(II)-dependent formamide hydrolase-like protein
MARPIDAIDTVFLEEMTWLEVRDALAAGKRTAILASGGIEQNGPYLATGKHNYILRATTEAIARKLGDALVAPIVGFVPEGDFDPPTEHMKYPGSISVRPETFDLLLTDIVTSLKAHGFEHIMLIADSGGNVKGMQAVAERLHRQWNGRPAVRYIAEYYNYPDVAKWLETQGVKQTPEGIHDDFAITSQMMVVNPETVRMKQRMAKGKFRINGVALAPADRTIGMGRRVIEYRAEAAAAAIRRARAR